jgi:hypothetical protein
MLSLVTVKRDESRAPLGVSSRAPEVSLPHFWPIFGSTVNWFGLKFRTTPFTADLNGVVHF